MCLCTYVHKVGAHQHMRNMHAHLLALLEETHVLFNVIFSEYPLGMSHAVPVSMLLGVPHGCTYFVYVCNLLLYVRCAWNSHLTVCMKASLDHRSIPAQLNQ